MLETVDFRIPERNADEYLAGVGERLPSGVRRVVLSTDDPMFHEIGRLHKEFRSRGESFFFGNVINRKYSAQELASADLFEVATARTFEPAGEECGTIYDDSRACPICGTSAPQVTPLYLDGRTIPGNTDVARTIAGEIVVSEKTAELVRAQVYSGVLLGPVYLSNRKDSLSEHYFQLLTTGHLAEVDRKRTRVGQNVFDKSRYGACPCGVLIGLNKLSEVWLEETTELDTDFCRTRETVGSRRGLLRPESFLLARPRVREAVVAAKLRGFVFEVSHCGG